MSLLFLNVSNQNRRSFIKTGLALSATAWINPAFPTFTVKDTPPLIPSKLQQGDHVAIVGLAGALNDNSQLSAFEKTLKNLGFVVHVSPSASASFGYFSGTDSLRAKDLMDQFQDPLIKAIFCIKGGWGAARILDKLDYDIIKKNPKLIIGFSDITSVLLAIYQKTGLVTFHGPVGVSSWEDFTLQSFLEITSGKLSFPIPSTELITYKLGQVEGTLIGGNLSVLCSLLGTPYFPNCDGGILFLEETHEEPYSIDRMLTSLHLAGVFKDIQGLILGQFTHCEAEHPELSFTVQEVLNQHLASFEGPIITNAPIGHVKDKWTIPIGIKAQLDAHQKTITLLHAAVG